MKAKILKQLDLIRFRMSCGRRLLKHRAKSRRAELISYLFIGSFLGNPLFCNGAETCVAGTDPCTGDTPECIEEGTGTCVECLIDADCAEEEICEDNMCIDGACPADTPEEVLLFEQR